MAVDRKIDFAHLYVRGRLAVGRLGMCAAIRANTADK